MSALSSILVEVSGTENGEIFSVLRLDGRRPQVGDILKLSDAPTKWIFWAVAIGDGIDRASVACILKGVGHETPPPEGATLYFDPAPT